VGGHCLTKDTYHLERGVQMLGPDLLDYPQGEPSLFVLARRINDFMPTHMFRLTMDGLKRAGVPPKDAKIALLGWAFLANSDDTRNTPAEPYRDLLVREGARVSIHDPYVAEYPGLTFEPFVEDAVRGADAIVIFAGHNLYRGLDVPYLRNLTGKKHPVIVDGRNLVDADACIKAGFIYKGIGRGDRNSHPLVE
jgi:UDP-N-acetyl-D-mannosaminuronic acid dehydrogenase